MVAIAQLMMSASSLLFRNAEGDEIWIASILYNATISALEVRAYRPEGTPPVLVAALGKGPLRIFEMMSGIAPTMPAKEDLRATVHFETATLGFGFECDPGACDRNGNPLRGTTVVREVVILRGLRVE